MEKGGFRNRAAAPRGLGQTYHRRPKSFYRRVHKQLGVRAKLTCYPPRACCLTGLISWSITLDVAASVVTCAGGNVAWSRPISIGTCRARWPSPARLPGSESEDRSGSIPGRLGSSSEPGTFPWPRAPPFFLFFFYINNV
jgi:hypothetical protein